MDQGWGLALWGHPRVPQRTMALAGLVFVLVACSPAPNPAFPPPAPAAALWVKTHLPLADVLYTGPSNGPAPYHHWEWWQVIRPLTFDSKAGRVSFRKNWFVVVALGPGSRSSHVEGVFYATQRHPMTFHPLIPSFPAGPH